MFYSSLELFLIKSKQTACSPKRIQHRGNTASHIFHILDTNQQFDILKVNLCVLILEHFTQTAVRQACCKVNYKLYDITIGIKFIN